jgi:hypothetical protein
MNNLPFAPLFLHPLFPFFLVYALVFLPSLRSCQWSIIRHLHRQIVLSHRQTQLFIYK